MNFLISLHVFLVQKQCYILMMKFTRFFPIKQKVKVEYGFNWSNRYEAPKEVIELEDSL